MFTQELNTIKQINLTQGKIALIDSSDFSNAAKYKWCYDASTGYARRTDSNNKKVYLHRFILNSPSGKLTDHINGDKLNNSRSNLRLVDKFQNARNTLKGPGVSAFKGVAWFKRDACWRSQISINGRNTHIGYFKSEHHAAMAYDIWAKEAYGEYAKLNFKSV